MVNEVKDIIQKNTKLEKREERICPECGEPIDYKTNVCLNVHDYCRLEL